MSLRQGQKLKQGHTRCKAWPLSGPTLATLVHCSARLPLIMQQAGPDAAAWRVHTVGGT